MRGFLRILDGEDPLDRSGVHPEAYPLVRRILDQLKTNIHTLIGDVKLLKQLNPAQFIDQDFGLPTIRDVFSELEKPGRDPRPAFKTATFLEGVETLKDLKPGMVLEGVVTNVAAFGAFCRHRRTSRWTGSYLSAVKNICERSAHNCETRRYCAR